MSSPYGGTEPRIVEHIRRLFVGRADCYGRQTGLEDPKYISEKLPLGDDVILRHLHGDITVGPYCKDQSGRVKWFCADFDTQHHGDVFASAKKTLAYVSKTFPPASILVEQSQSGKPSIHLWVFLEQTPVKAVHIWGERLKKDLAEPALEFFPKVGDVDAPLGMLVKLPLGGPRMISTELRVRIQCSWCACRFASEGDRRAHIKAIHEKWRTLPPTPAQLELLEKLGYEGCQESRGSASRAISGIRRGAFV